jgi:hypothetical protein
VTQTAWGQLADRTGHALAGGRAWSSPSSAYSLVQDAQIAITRDHAPPILGKVAYLERTRSALWAVGEIDDSLSAVTRVGLGDRVVDVATDLFWSAAHIEDEDAGLLLTGVGVTAYPARSAPEPIRLEQGELHRRGSWSGLSTFEYGLLERAEQAQRKRRGGESIVIHDVERQKLLERAHPAELAQLAEDTAWSGSGRPPGPLRHSPTYHGVISVR